MGSTGGSSGAPVVVGIAGDVVVGAGRGGVGWSVVEVDGGAAAVQADANTKNALTSTSFFSKAGLVLGTWRLCSLAPEPCTER